MLQTNYHSAVVVIYMELSCLKSQTDQMSHCIHHHRGTEPMPSTHGLAKIRGSCEGRYHTTHSCVSSPPVYWSLVVVHSQPPAAPSLATVYHTPWFF